MLKLDELYKHCDAARKPHEADWYANAQYLRGNQLDELPTDVRRIISRRMWLPKQSKKVQYVGNRMLSLYRQALSFMLDSVGRQVAIPSTDEEIDRLAAELGTDVLEYLGDRNDERKRRMRGIGWTMIAGRVLEKADWNPELDGLGPEGILHGSGDLETTTLNPLQFHLDPWAESLAEASFVLEVGIRDIGELKEIFGAEATKNLKPEAISDQTYLLDAILGSLTASAGGGGFVQAPKREDGVLLKTWCFRPTTKNKQGLVIWQAQQSELHESELPEGRMPFTELVWLPLPGQAQPVPYCSPLRSPSHYQNVLRSQMIALSNSQLRGDTIRSGTGGEVKQKVDPETGRKDLVAPPGSLDFKLMQYQLDWAAAAKTYEDMWDDSQQVAGLRGSSIGENPPNVNTVGQLMLLKEPDTQGMKLFRVGFEKGYAQLGKLELEVIQNHYTEQRLLRLMGEDQKVRTTAFYGAQLKGVVDVKTKSLPSMTEAERRQAMAELAAPPNECFGPYLDATGSFSLQVKRARLTRMMNSGIPDIEKEVEKLAAPMSFEELCQTAAQLDLMDTEKEALQRQAEMAQLNALLNPPEEETQSPEEQMVAQMMGGGEQSQEQPAMAAGGP